MDRPAVARERGDGPEAQPVGARGRQRRVVLAGMSDGDIART